MSFDLTVAGPLPAPSDALAESFLVDVAGTTELFLIRHGQQHHPSANAPAMESHDPPLSSVGQRQARAVGTRLAAEQLTAIYASPLRRAFDTASAVAAHHNLDIKIRKDLREVELFRDVPPGMTLIEAFGAERVDEARQQMVARMRWEVYPASESGKDLRRRVVAVMEEVAAENVGGRVAVVCHGGVINAFIAALINASPDMIFRPAHAGMTVLHSKQRRTILVTANDIGHLTKESVTY